MQMGPTVMSEFDYYLLPGKVDDTFQRMDLYEQVYSFWKAFWVREMSLAGGDMKFVLSDDFLRQDAISVIRNRRSGEIIGMLFATVYHIERGADRDCKYFSLFSPEIMRSFSKKGVRSVSTMEFLAVNPEWRASRAGVSLGAVLGNLCLRRSKEIGVDVSIGVARTDNQVNKVCRQYGGLPLGLVTKAKIECEVVGIFTDSIASYPKEGVEACAEDLWNRRIDLTGAFQQQRLLRAA